ncbi:MULTISPECIES: outer membrane beta-barrel protein [unclassified Bradyrhizobium]|uniref:outer membrane beta-barrel protein n=1 Tax=unclassified Bradyrhizobium TaxID=2631580 RepID=UPI0024789B18|nr:MULTISPECIES: outer membrane beta-barrel protein [unclassified Bradyrhizobium]WGS19304.1 outer membrane beta-barrel protein [Bradyrhizobium sp. ISRA463]WGS26139.1 outer membrane beta-barrel protein [Bradyrhizobium sp. ISRA464]
MRSTIIFCGATTIALVASSAAKAADLEPQLKLPRAVWDWSGGYIGGHVGGGYGRTSFSSPYGPSIYGGIVDTPAFLAGGQVGYNWQNNSWVFGIELDASGAVSDGTNTCLASSGFVVSANCKAGPSLFATGTGRVGYAFGTLGHTLAYLKAGLAWQNNRGDVVNNAEGGRFPQGKTHFDDGRVGSVIGLGVEQALTPAWSVNVEYDYLHFGGPAVATAATVQFPSAILPPNTTNLSSNYHIGKIGLNYHFDADPKATEWSNAPPYAKSASSAPPIPYASGWSFEGGSRLWLSRGRFQWDHSGVRYGRPYEPSMLISRLTYHGLDGLSGELFGRLDSPWGVFLKSNVGLGQFNKGNMNDEDWGGSYVNTLSGQANGRFTYYTADVGYDFLRGSDYKVGGFIGWTYYGQSSDSIGCVQVANPLHRCLAPGDSRVIGGEDTQWNAPRIGLSAETMLTERWRLSADIAYLPWTDFKGRDYHLLRDETTFDEQHGNGGGGVQVEGVLSYFLTKNISVGVGGRYWAMWTKKRGDSLCSSHGCVGEPSVFGKYSMERWGTFFQASYKFD